MASKENKLRKSLKTLQEALKKFKKDDELSFLAVAKAFEISVEYSWRELKRIVEDEGLDAPSPKAAIREAARLGKLDDAEGWIEFVNVRNAGIHDYFGMGEEEYIEIAEDFLKHAKEVF